MTDLDKLQVAHLLRDFHHKSLWEEEKHFTWLCSILLSGQIVLLNSDKIAPHDRATVVLILGVVGVVLAIAAMRVIVLEGRAFDEASDRFVELRARLDYLRTPFDGKPRVPKAWLSLNSVRGLFGCVFLIFAATFAVLAVKYGWLALKCS